MANSTRIKNAVNKAITTSTAEFKAKLNDNVHVLDFSYNAVRRALQNITLDEYNILVDAVSSEYSKVNSLKTAMGIVKDPSAVRGYAAFVDDARYGTYLVGKNFDVLQRKLSKVLKNIAEAAPDLSEMFSRVNIGNVAGTEVNGSKTPMQQKLISVLNKLPLQAISPVVEQLNELYNAYEFETEFTSSLSSRDNNGFNKIVGKSTVVVTLQTESRTQDLAKLNASINAKLTKYFQSQEFIDSIITEQFVDNIGNLVANTIAGKNIKDAFNATSSEVSKTKTKVGGPVQGVAPNKIPPMRDNQGKFTSLAKLMALINQNLYEQIKGNMGNGSRRDILNFRSGRFAHSAEVQRLTMTKEGTIAAFYDYMKYPYQTFEPGFRQGSPRSRDPRILIGKSIEELARKHVTNRLKAVLV